MRMKEQVLLPIFLFSLIGAVFADEIKETSETFPTAPLAGMIFKTIQDEAGNAVKFAIWGKKDSFFWYFEPIPESLGKFCLYPGDITVTQNGKLYEIIEFVDKEGKKFFGPIKEPLIFQFTACEWDQSGIRCIDYTQPFEVYLAPNIYITIQKGTVVKVNSVEIKWQ